MRVITNAEQYIVYIKKVIKEWKAWMSGTNVIQLKIKV
jgi:hypothetical protein